MTCTTALSSDADNRRVALAPPMIGLAVEHKAWQDRERMAAGETWHDLGLVWCQKDGRPIDARADWAEWNEICRLVGVRKFRIHDGRHAAAAPRRSRASRTRISTGQTHIEPIIAPITDHTPRQTPNRKVHRRAPNSSARAC